MCEISNCFLCVCLCLLHAMHTLIGEKFNFQRVLCDSFNPAPMNFLCQLVCVCVCVLRFQFAVISDSTSLIPTEGQVVGRRELLLLHTRQLITYRLV